jgi:DNA-binding HxlR family transcriptional regulator
MSANRFGRVLPTINPIFSICKVLGREMSAGNRGGYRVVLERGPQGGTFLSASTLHVAEGEGRPVPDGHQLSEQCRFVHEILALVGEKWSMVVVMSLSGHARRFSDIQRAIPGISQRMLTRTLRSLERDGLVKRTVTPTIPPRVDYELTGMGGSLCESLSAVGRWSKQNQAAVRSAREAFDARSPQTASR